MSQLRGFFRRLGALLRRRRLERDLDDELAFHLEMRHAEGLDSGLTPDEAAIAARRRFGTVALIKEQTRDAWTLPSLESWAQDLRFAARSLSRSPGFAVVAILTIALGVGANTAIFAVVRAVLLKPLPYPESERLVQLTEATPATEAPDGRSRRSGNISVAELLELRARSGMFSHVGLNGGPAIVTLSGRGEATRLQGMRVTAGTFETLGVAPLLGRGFSAAEEVPDGAAIVLSYPSWQRYFKGDQEILGQRLTLTNNLTPNPNGVSQVYAVVGVMPEGFEFWDGQIQFWIPIRWAPTSRGALIARLADGVSREAATSELGALLREMRKAPAAVTYDLSLAQEAVAEPVKPALLVLTGAAAFVLLIACVNVANLLFARTATRQREIAIRLALGAGRGRVIRHLLTESFLLAVVGGLGGLVLAFGGVRLLKTLASTLSRMDLGVQLPFPRLDEIGVDTSVLVFVVAVSVVAGLLFGLAPAVRLSRSGQMGPLRESAATAYAGFSLFRRGGGRGLLVASEIALALMLLVGGGLLLRSFARLSSVPLGYNPASVLTFQVALPAERYTVPTLRTFAEELVGRLRTVPGVGATAYGQLPMVALTESALFRRTPDVPPRATPGGPELRLVSHDYLEVMGIRVLAGRGFREGDQGGRSRVVLVNQVLARREFSNEDAIGQQVFAGSDSVPWEIVGIVDDVRQASPDREPGPQVFVTFSQWTGNAVFPLGPYYSIRTHGDPMAFVSSVRSVARQLDPEAGLFNIATMDRVVANRTSRARMYAVFLGIFAGVAGALAAIGIYGVMSYAVAQRTREIGIRMALGARRHQVMTLVLGQSVTVIGLGIVAGLAGAIAVTRYLEGLLFGLSPLDGATFLAVCAMFVTVAVVAAAVPARRATKVDPLIALRCE